MLRADTGEALHALQYISEMPQGVLHVLRRLVGCPCKRAERSHVGKIPLLEPADVYGYRLSLHYILRRIHNIRRKVQTVGKVVCAAGGYVAHRYFEARLHDAGDGLVEGAISAYAHYAFDPFAVFFNEFGRVPPFFGNEYKALIAVIGKQRYYLGKELSCVPQPRLGVEDQQKRVVCIVHDQQLSLNTVSGLYYIRTKWH